MICTNATNIISVVAIQLYFKMRSSTSSNPAPVSSSLIPKIRSPHILANLIVLGGAIFQMLKMLRGDIKTNKYTFHLIVAVGVSPVCNKVIGRSCEAGAALLTVLSLTD